MADIDDFTKATNERIRRAFGTRSGGAELSPERKAFADWVRNEAVRRTWETDLATGEITRVEGSPVRNRGDS